MSERRSVGRERFAPGICENKIRETFGAATAFPQPCREIRGGGRRASVLFAHHAKIGYEQKAGSSRTPP